MPEKKLIIAEKPSVAADIARALGGMSKQKDFFENDQYIISSAIGHLLEIIPPEGVEVKRGKWNLANLPVLPQGFDLRPIKKTEARLKLLKKLYQKKEVTSLINACDAGREGELIFFHIYRYLVGEQSLSESASSSKTGNKANSKANGKKTYQRLWLQSMTPTSIREGFNALKQGEELNSLKQAAVCRSEADWLVGINSTRAMTALNSTAGGFDLTTVGRVQTPTLAVIVERERQISAFIPQSYFEVSAQFSVAAGVYTGLWIGGEEKNVNKEDKKEDKKPERIFAKETVDLILADCSHQPGRIEETAKPSNEQSPLLFDLTSLQREGNNRFSLPARAVLATAQSLYERYKLITYPRTDSRALPQDYVGLVRKNLQNFLQHPEIGHLAKKIIDQNWVQGANKRVFNDKKVSDHFAIIPTGVLPSSHLGEKESKIYNLILRRFLSVFFPAAEFLITERKTWVKKHLFITKGKDLKKPGWREVIGQSAKENDWVPIEKNEEAMTKELIVEEKITQPPPHYNEATLLSVMEGAGKLIENEELREVMKARGLGTPATRASIIEGLLREGYLLRDGRELIATPKAKSLMRLLSSLKVDMLTQPSLTAEWEYQLRQIESAKSDPATFMKEIREVTSFIVQSAQNCGNVEKVEGDYVTLSSPCPVCKGTVCESYRRFYCQKCDFFIWRSMAQREFSVEEIEQLLRDGKTDSLEGFRSRLGYLFAASVCLHPKENEEGLAAVFDFPKEPTTTLDEAQLQKCEVVGDCPKCGKTVRHVGPRYQCEANRGETPQCDFVLSGRILQQEISLQTAKQLLQKGKTDVLDKFISKKSRRPFKARLKMNLEDKKANLEFEFPESKRASKAS